MAAFADLVHEVKDIEISGDPATKINKIEVDSRLVEKGDLFVAVDGYALDGAQFIPDAIRNGAVAVIASRPVQAKLACFAVVSDIRSAVAKVAARFFGYPSRELTLVGVTGTNGKTTITYLVRSILRQLDREAGLIGTLGYFTGSRSLKAINTTPGPVDIERLLREMRDEDLNYAVMEISSHGLSMKRVEELHFKAAAISNITQDHLDFHPSFEAYRDAKAHLLDLMTGDDQHVALNLDDPSFDYLQGRVKCNLASFAVHNPAADFHVEELTLSTEGSQFKLVTPKGKVEINLKLLGRFNVANALCAATLGMAAGASLEQVVAGLNAQGMVHGRADRIETGRNFTVLVDFAHTPDAIDQIGCTAREICSGRLLILFGCGGDRDRTKRVPMAAAACRHADLVIVTSDNPRSEDPLDIIEDIKPGLNSGSESIIEPDRRKAIEAALSLCTEGDVLVVAGKGHENYQIVGSQKSHFDDREVIEQWLEGGHQ